MTLSDEIARTSNVLVRDGLIDELRFCDAVITEHRTDAAIEKELGR